MTYASFVGLNRFLGSRFVLFEKKKEAWCVHRVRRRVRVCENMSCRPPIVTCTFFWRQMVESTPHTVVRP